MGEQETLEMVARHDETLNHVTKSIERLADAVEKTDDKMDKVIEALGQNAVILEKIANIDASNKDSVNRLHKRIDAIDASNKDSVNRLHKRIDNTENVMIAKEKEMLARITEIASDASKGAHGYDLLVYTAKAIAWGVGILAPVLAGIAWIVDHYKG